MPAIAVKPGQQSQPCSHWEARTAAFSSGGVCTLGDISWLSPGGTEDVLDPEVLFPLSCCALSLLCTGNPGVNRAAGADQERAVLEQTTEPLCLCSYERHHLCHVQEKFHGGAVQTPGSLFQESPAHRVRPAGSHLHHETEPGQHGQGNTDLPPGLALLHSPAVLLQFLL